ncbi:efflux RND transporter periplasmic adaptor subunit [Thiomicrorhabdus sp. ZW0627]|uniref:efflux RND transporter periplasmic adaptor subunit n=1 Tax=Thiomicrorhabdus sp. ZW0627 TaxID=3039774 RepID=UPI002436A573|nr:efflux RND transporter periplasmic adaptor subunit [Thiomicrorhabdus sp. ZW0627]MDG6773892.1 efflux RND transporter periplasmic adaptor subunit [Thiomicrorhabdus sp. ZW0627]
MKRPNRYFRELCSALLLLASPISCTQAAPIQTQIIPEQIYDQYVSLGGTIIPFKEVSINAQVAGQVNYISGIEGDPFRSGTLLVSIDDDVLRAQRNAALAQWQQASYAHENALNQYNRELWSPKTAQSMPGMALPGLMDQVFSKPMSNSMGYGNTQVDRQANMSSALSHVKETEAMMQQIKSKIDEIDVILLDTKSIAPFDGVIVKKMVEAGDTVQPGQPMMTFAKSNHLSIEVNVPVNLMIGIRKGDIFHARLANKLPIQVRVAQIFPVANNQQHTVTVKFDLPVGTPAAPGMYAEVSVLNSSSQQQAFPTVPSSSIVQRGSLPCIYTVNPKTQKVEMRVIRTGDATTNGYYIVLSGVRTGETVITNPPMDIVSGWILDKDKLIDPKKSANEL